MSAATPQPEPSWRDGLTFDEQLGVYAEVFGWFKGTNPDEFSRALAAALRQVEADRARLAAREVVAR